MKVTELLRGPAGGWIRVVYMAGATGLLIYGSSGSIVQGCVAGVLFSLFIGPAMWRSLLREWPDGRRLTPEDRAAVLRAFRRGGPLPDAHLAQDVLDYAETVHRVRSWSSADALPR